MSSVEKSGAQYSIPSSIVHTVVATLIIMSLGSTTGAVYTIVRINQGLDKLQSLPSARTIAERRERQRDINNGQNRRIERLEQAMFGHALSMRGERELPAAFHPRPQPNPEPTRGSQIAYKKDEDQPVKLSDASS